MAAAKKKSATSSTNKGVMGRPTAYNADTVTKSEAYLESAHCPTTAGLAKCLGVHRETILEWGKHPDRADFSDLLKRIATYQEVALIEGGLMGVYNSNMASMMLSRHGWVKQVSVAGDEDKPITHKHTVVVGVVHLNAEEAAKTYFTELRPPE